MTTRIEHIHCQLFQVPLPEVLSDAKHGDHHFFELVTATIKLADGSTGTGYTYTGGKGGYAVKAMIEHDLAPALLGKDGALIEDLYDFMEWHIHYVGRGGIASFAISALDIALWISAVKEPASRFGKWPVERQAPVGLTVVASICSFPWKNY